MRRGIPTGTSTPSPLTATNVDDPDQAAPVNEVSDEPYTGSTNAPATRAPLHVNAAIVSQNA
jgi:hypothetical protein